MAGAPFRVLPAVGRAYLSGSLLTQAFESSVQSSGSQLTINLFDDILLDGVQLRGEHRSHGALCNHTI